MTDFADGEWHRLHPATPLLKGGIALIAILGAIIVNLRDVFIDGLFGDGGRGDDGEPLLWIASHGFVGIAIAAIVGGLLLFIAGFYVSWRMHTFRITDEVVEVRSGILFRTNRKGRLDRIQGINISRPFIARLFGAAKLEVNVAGQHANVQLEYLTSDAADSLRREILRLASGTKQADAAAVHLPEGSVIDRRVTEFLAPELDPATARAESVVTMHLGRLIGSLVLSGFTLFLIGLIVLIIVGVSATGEVFFVIGILPAIIGSSSFYINRFTKSLRYTISSTPDGIRVGFGLLSTSNETLPPGRIHSIQVSQPLFWRPAGWWQVRINRASTSSAKGAAGQANTTILPVGDLGDVRKVLALVLPGLVDEVSVALLAAGLTSKGGDDGFVTSPRRAAIIRWFSWRRNGFALSGDAVLLRKGAIWRELVVVPLARMQSLSIEQGPLRRSLRVATLRLHTVAGPITPVIGAIDSTDALGFFQRVADAAAVSASADTSHRWRSSELPASGATA